MNKIQLMYDVVKTMHGKETVNGMIKAEVDKDRINIFSMQNDFEKNLLSGRIKAKAKAEVDYEGKRVKRESNDGVFMRFFAAKQHEFRGHSHHLYGSHAGLKGRLSKAVVALSVLNAMQVEEREDKTIVISLHAMDLPEDMKQLFHEKMLRAGECRHHGHSFMGEFLFADKLDLRASLFINENYEIETVALNVDGIQIDEQGKQHLLKAKADLRFAW
ncbi:MAG: hypothetical protein ABFC57_01045 [Veillonellales bacterium]